MTLAEQSRHLNDGGVEDVENKLRRDPDGEHEQRDGNNDPFLAAPEIGKGVTTLRQRTAEERLHHAHEDDGGNEKADYGDGCERRGDRE